jgi:hypothetical protein
MKKCQHMLVWLRKIIFLLQVCSVCWGWWKAQQICAHAREECNKCDVTPDPSFGLANHNDWSRWFAISSSHLFCSPQSPFQFDWRSCKKVLNYTWMWEIFLQGHTYWAPMGMLLQGPEWTSSLSYLNMWSHGNKNEYLMFLAYTMLPFIIKNNNLILLY